MADNVLLPGHNSLIAADEVGGALYQRFKRSAGSDGVAVDFMDKASRFDTYTSASAGTTFDVSTQGMSKFALQVTKTGAVTSWTVVLEVSLNGANFVPILTHSDSGSGDGAIEFTGSTKWPALYFRSRCTALSLGGGTNVVATILGMP